MLSTTDTNRAVEMVNKAASQKPNRTNNVSLAQLFKRLYDLINSLGGNVPKDRPLLRNSYESISHSLNEALVAYNKAYSVRDGVEKVKNIHSCYESLEGISAIFRVWYETFPKQPQKNKMNISNNQWATYIDLNTKILSSLKKWENAILTK